MKQKRKTEILPGMIGLLFLLTGCKVKNADTLYSQARKEHGACTIVSGKESENGTFCPQGCCGTACAGYVQFI